MCFFAFVSKKDFHLHQDIFVIAKFLLLKTDDWKWLW